MSELHSTSLNVSGSLSLGLIKGGAARRLRTASNLDQLKNKNNDPQLSLGGMSSVGRPGKVVMSPTMRNGTKNSAPLFRDRPLSERASGGGANGSLVKSDSQVNRKFWISKPHYSVFSATGMESLISKLDLSGRAGLDSVSSPRMGFNGGGAGEQTPVSTSGMPSSIHPIGKRELSDDASGPEADFGSIPESGSPGSNGDTPPSNLSRAMLQPRSNSGVSVKRKLSYGPVGMPNVHESRSSQSQRQSRSALQMLQSQKAMYSGPSMRAIIKPEDDEKAAAQWEEYVKAWEADGEWIEARETLSGRIMWFNSHSFRIVFDTAPEGVQPVSSAQYAKHLGASHQDYLANRPIEPYEGEDVVDALLNTGMHAWDFQNDMVDTYRAQAHRRDHHEMLPHAEQYVAPEFFSQSPLPVLKDNQFLAKIRLPVAYAAHRRHVTIRIKVDYTTSTDAIKQGVEKLDPPHNEDSSPWFIKLVGKEEYIYGDKKIADYEAVRNAVRNEDDVEFALVRRPDFAQQVEKAKKKKEQYELSFQTAYPSLVRDPDFLPEEQIQGNLQALSAPKSKDFTPLNFVSLYDLEWNYRLKIEGVTNSQTLPRYDEQTMKGVYVEVELWNGDCIFQAGTLKTSEQPAKSSIRWGTWLSSRNLSFSQIPREAIICFTLYGVTAHGLDDEVLAWSRLPLIDHRHRLRRGKYLINLWEIPVFKLHKEGPKTDPYLTKYFRYRGTTRDKHVKASHAEDSESDLCQLLVEFDQFAFDVIAPRLPPKNVGSSTYHEAAVGVKMTKGEKTSEQDRRLKEIIKTSPLKALSHEDKNLVWRARDLLWHYPDALPCFLRSVNWTSRIHIAEAHKYLEIWYPPKQPEDVLEFLDYRFADTLVRERAIEWLDDMDDGNLQIYLLQLVQCLKYEAHHDSALARFLIRRGLKNPYQIGHYLFWHLKAEYHDLQVCERFGLIAEEYLKHAGEHSRQLFIQSTVLKRLEIIAAKVFHAKHTTSKDQCKRLLKKELNKLNRDLPDTIQIPLNPRWSAKKIRVDRCRYMGSKKVPLWICFENADPYAQDIEVMFKSGDDLRQDMLTLQIIDVMDRIWLQNNLVFNLSPYNVIATGVNKDGEGVGMLEIVLNSKTINTINVENGGAWNEKTINAFLVQNNKGERNLKKARENFARACAGYCVATFVMGIGDRHSDNIMVKKKGHLFHIDFGHFLGNFKSKKLIGINFNRERSPFVFTPAMKYAIDGGKKSAPLYEDKFLNWVADAYNVLRVRSRLFLVLFGLMTSAGMPELMSEPDIDYLQNMLQLHYDEKKARQHIRKLVAMSLRDTVRLFDNYVHQRVHS